MNAALCHAVAGGEGAEIVELVSQLVAGSAAVGGVLVVRRWMGWRPGSDGAGSEVRRHGAELAERAGDAAEDAGRFAGRVVGGVVRGGGTLAARSMGTSIDLIDGVVVRLVPGTRRHRETTSSAASSPAVESTSGVPESTTEPGSTASGGKPATKASKRATKKASKRAATKATKRAATKASKRATKKATKKATKTSATSASAR